MIARSLILALLGALLFVTNADAQEVGHAWFVSSQRDGRADVLHLPPWQDEDLRPESARLVFRLNRWPDAITWWDDRMYVVLRKQEGGATGSQRRVLSKQAVSFGRTWSYEPTARPLAVAALDGNGRIEAFEACDRGPVALMYIDGTRQLLLLDDTEWKPVELPDNLPADRAVVMGGLRGGLMIAAESAAPNTITFFEGTFDEDQLTWAPPRTLTGAEGTPVTLQQIGQHRLLVTRTTEGYRLHEVHPWEELSTGTLLEAEAEAQLLARRTAGFALLGPTKEGTGITGGEVWPIREVGPTGTERFTGELRRAGPVSGTEVRTLVLILVLTGLTIALSILRPENTGDVVIPEFYALASPMRRLVAANTDVLLSLLPGLAVASLRDLSLNQILADPTLTMSGIFTTLAIAFAHTTVAEALFGRSVGKFLANCRVIRVHPDVAGTKPSWRAAAIRNLFRWMLPPITTSILADPYRRHVGDYAAGTVVVTPIDHDEEGA